MVIHSYKNWYKKTVLLTVLLIWSGFGQAADLEAKTQESRQVVQTFGKALKGTLVAAMQEGGPINAVGVCNLSAPEIASSVSAEQSMNISRTSLKYRNSGNAPSDWQQQVLEQFNQMKDAGSDPGKLEHAEIVDTDAGQEFRYMKAIPTGNVCLACHGGSLPDDLAAKIAELYPEDKATGYAKGDIRGAFVVTESLQ